MSQVVTTDAQPGEYSTMETQAPVLEVLKPTGVGYNYYYFISDAYDADGNEVTGWANDGGDIADANEIACGTAFWYKSVGGASTLTMPGEVLNDASVTKTLRADDFDLIGNPFPIALTLTKLSQTFPAGEYSTMETQAPMIEVLKPTGVGYNYYYLISDAYDADGNEVTGWANDGGDIVYDPVAGISQGVWIRLRATAGSLTFAK